METQEKEHPILYRIAEMNMGGISGSAVRTITLKPAFAKTVLLIFGVQGCSAPRANVRDRVKHRVASVKPANFSGSFGLMGNISVSMSKKLSSQKKPEFSLKNYRKTPEIDWKTGFV